MGSRRRSFRKRTTNNAQAETPAQLVSRLKTTDEHERRRSGAAGPAAVVAPAAAQDAASSVLAALAAARYNRRARRVANTIARQRRAGASSAGSAAGSAPVGEPMPLGDAPVDMSAPVGTGTGADVARAAEAAGNVFDVVEGVSISGGGASATRHDPRALDWDFVDWASMHLDATSTVEGTSAPRGVRPAAPDGGTAATDSGVAVLAALARRNRARGGTPPRAVDVGGLPTSTSANTRPANTCLTSRARTAADVELGVEEVDHIPLAQPRPLTAPTRAVPAPSVPVLGTTSPPVLRGVPSTRATGTASFAFIEPGDIFASMETSELYLHELWLRNDDLQAATEEEVIMHGVADMASQEASQVGHPHVGDFDSQTVSDEASSMAALSGV